MLLFASLIVKFDASHQVNVKQILTAAALSHATGVFHIYGANISHRRYFTRSDGTNFTEKSICNPLQKYCL